MKRKAGIPMGTSRCLQELRTKDSSVEIPQKKIKMLVLRFSCHDQNQEVQQLFSSTINPFSLEISRLALQTQMFDSSNNLLINNKEAVSRRDNGQAGFALLKSMRASTPTFKTPLPGQTHAFKTLLLTFRLPVSILAAYSTFLTFTDISIKEASKNT